jgi:hypothetical protein
MRLQKEVDAFEQIVCDEIVCGYNVGLYHLLLLTFTHVAV